MIAPDQRGLLSKAAGVLTLNSLRVHSASVNMQDGVAISEFVVSPHFGSPPAAGCCASSSSARWAGRPTCWARWSSASARPPKPIGDAPTAVPVHQPSAPPRILWFEGAPVD